MLLWIGVVVASIVWIIGASYLIFVLYYRLSRGELFVPFVPADPQGIETMCRAVSLSGNENVVDIGSGWGSIVFPLADKYPKIRITGVEINPILHILAVIRNKIFHPKHVITLLRADASVLDYSKYDVIFLFMLSPFVNQVLVPKFEKELKPGTRVVSYVFKMNSPAFTEKDISIPAHGWRSAVYVYTKR